MAGLFFFRFNVVVSISSIVSSISEIVSSVSYILLVRFASEVHVQVPTFFISRLFSVWVFFVDSSSIFMPQIVFIYFLLLFVYALRFL